MAQRIVAQPGGHVSAGGKRSNSTPARRALHSVPAGAFLPAPKVDSSVVRLDLTQQPDSPRCRPNPILSNRTRRFGQRRKQLRNSLSAGLSCKKEEADSWLNAAARRASRRPQTLSISEWGELTGKCTGKNEAAKSRTSRVGELLAANLQAEQRQAGQWPASGASGLYHMRRPSNQSPLGKSHPFRFHCYWQWHGWSIVPVTGGMNNRLFRATAPAADVA